MQIGLSDFISANIDDLVVLSEKRKEQTKYFEVGSIVIDAELGVEKVNEGTAGVKLYFFGGEAQHAKKDINTFKAKIFLNAIGSGTHSGGGPSEQYAVVGGAQKREWCQVLTFDIGELL